MVSFTLNDKRVSVDADANTPLLWVIRDHVGLTGTKYGCGAGLCGACTVHVNGKAVRSCQTQVSEVAGKKVVTIEGLSPNSSHPLQKAWMALEGAAVRLLPVRPDHEGGRAAGQQSEADPRADRRAHGRQHLPLRHLSPHHRRDRTRVEGGLSHDNAMLKAPELSRRGVLAGLGGMTFCLALGTDGVRLVSEAQANTLANAQVTPWVRIAPDGTITILTAGAEMGQGSMTCAAAHPRRGARCRLVEGEDRMGAGRCQGLRLQGPVRPEQDDVDRRQPRGRSSITTICASPARRCARC